MQAEEDLQSLRRNVMDEEGATKGQRAEVEKHQLELDRLAATLKQVEVYNEQMKVGSLPLCSLLSKKNKNIMPPFLF